MTPRLTTRIVLSAVVLLSLGCRSAEQRQSDELREVLLRILDEVEEVYEKELAVRKSTDETYKELEELEALRGIDRARRGNNEKLREKRAEDLEAMRTRVKEYTSLELPDLARIVRILPGEAEGFVTRAQKAAEQAREYVREAKKRASQKTVRKHTASAGNRKSGSTIRPRPASTTKQAPAKPPPPPPDLEELRKTYSARIEKVDQMHEDLIEILTAVQSAQTDKWQKRWAGDAVTMARLGRRKDISPLRSKLEGAKNVSDLNRLQTSIAFQEHEISNQIKGASEKLKAAKKKQQ